MADEESILRPETRALDALIKATVARLKQQKDRGKSDAMLFMGNWHQAIPASVIQDPVLEPVDKLVWMVIMLHARETGGRTAFPSYDTLAAKANVSSTSTISRAIAILRLTRWLTLCARVRQKSGQFKGNVYILHDEPLPLLDALHLDAEYMRFVEQSIDHYHARVRNVAQAVLDSLDQDILSGQALSSSEPIVERRLQAADSLINNTNNSDKAGRYFSFTASAIDQLNKSSRQNKPPVHDQDQNSKADEKGKESSCSSHYINTTTTHETDNSNSEQRGFQAGQSDLVYPSRLSTNQKALADRYLAMVDPNDRQPVLDELQGRLASEQKGMSPVYDELRFLHSLCKAAKQGAFVPNLGIKVADSRRARTRTPTAPAKEPDNRKISKAKDRSLAHGQQQLAMLRKSLGIKKDH